ncbi:MAG: hypothetical protein A2Y76_05865 [Planctomycetes bacterium RBG_13_60_9]|nr:MAG: hypothetical protein A2Y76_05865 [Planctomycetes bacterium RBG_13_60_9]
MQHRHSHPQVFDYLADRRTFLKGATLLSAGLMLNRSPAVRGAQPPAPAPAAQPARSRVSFLTGTDRREMVHKAMEPFKEEIQKGIQDKQVYIKPNFVSTNVPLCATHVDAVRGVLDFLKPLYAGKIIIGESSAMGSPVPGFENYGYRALEKEYNVELVDLNTHPTQSIWVIDRNIHAVPCEMIADFMDTRNYFISVTRLKTHDTVVATMGLKNMLMAAPVNGGGRRMKRVMHSGGPRWLHYNLFLAAQRIRPQLTVIDGLEGMQGSGPIRGTPIDHGVALAGADVCAVDAIGAQLMDIPLENIGYLTYCGNAGLGVTDYARIDIIGDKAPKDYVKKYELHAAIEQLLEWKTDLPFGQTPRRG